MTDRARGRHAKPPSKLGAQCDRVIDAVLIERNRRKLFALGTGAVFGALLAMGAAMWLPDRPGRLDAGAAARQGPALLPAPMAGDPDDVPAAVAYYRVKDPGREVAGHVRDVRRSGSFLRVYTDLREADQNSRLAISLCEWTAEFLREHDGEGAPIVFVHAKENDNGHVVLANKQSAVDDCRVGDHR
ncbi:hypothetical protein [Thermomonospora umbrina]|uniref:Uncharacterized protein n=1 Tax=Thermomonospora umbrina TaxID=111806 RepID=A0A3D9SH76_9ACTN|nr:hypothetical protein [Thermomonospora umbrina]REE95259.1 hypothetical protein DFJ69_0642 [Thermomonospora umbrina]